MYKARQLVQYFATAQLLTIGHHNLHSDNGKTGRYAIREDYVHLVFPLQVRKTIAFVQIEFAEEKALQENLCTHNSHQIYWDIIHLQLRTTKVLYFVDMSSTWMTSMTFWYMKQ